MPFERTLTSDDLPTSPRGRRPAAVPRVVVGNAGIHTGAVARTARLELARLGACLDDVPAYSPERSRIEPLFERVRHHDITVRSSTSGADLRRPVEGGFDTCRRLTRKRDNEPRRAA